MKTKIFEATDENIQKAGDILRAGGLVAFPTETVYGLGANAFDEEAVKKVYRAKGRPADNPMIVHIARASDIGQLTGRLDATMIKLIENFWPGPLTLVVKMRGDLPKVTTGGLDTVAVRIPSNDIALKLITEAGVPVAAPSANLSGKSSPTKAEHVISDLDGRIDCILKGEDCRIGIESTVLDLTSDELTILRPGVITAEQIEAATGQVVNIDRGLLEEGCAPKSPGMKYKHYAPEADMFVIEGARIDVEREIYRMKELNEKMGNKVGIILFEEEDFIQAAHLFFAQLRDLDKEGVDLILAGALSYSDGVGFAVMNRMMKSAGYKVVKV